MESRADFRNMRARTIPRALSFAAQAHAGRPFLRESGAPDWLTYTQAWERSVALARGLATLEVKPGDYVPFMLPNSADFILAWFAVNLRGAAYVSVNTSLVDKLLAAQLAIGRARLWVVDAEYLPVLEALPSELRESVEVLVVVGLGDRTASGWARVARFEDLACDGEDDPCAPVHFLDVAAISFTSGTTGPSKGVMVANSQAVTSALNFAEIVALTADDVIYTPLPLFHGMSSRMGVLPTLLTGGRIVIGKRFSGTRFWSEVIEADATVAQIIFSIPNVLLAQPPSPRDRAHRVTRMYNAHHTAAFGDRFGVQLIEAFAMSEVGFVTCSPPAEQRPGSAGRAHADWDVAIVDEDGLAVPDGTAGEIVCRPRQPGLMMRGYLHQPDRVVEATRDLWFHTGDIARRDTDGYIWFLDRAKERIRRRGENISSLEIEDAVRGHPGIADAAAMAHPAREGEDDIRLAVVPHDGHTVAEPELHGWLASRLPRFMVPRFIEVLPSLPYTATNKVEKTRLMAAGLTSGAWDAEAAPVRTKEIPLGA